MNRLKAKQIVVVAIVIALAALVGLLVSCLTAPTEDIGGDEYKGGLVWNNFTLTISGGIGELPTGVQNLDFARCKACHGWDTRGLKGGYVRRTGYPEKDSRPKPVEEADLGSKLGKIKPADVAYVHGRDWASENNEMPNFTQTGGLTNQQIADVVAFLNKGPKIIDVAELDTSQKPVRYIFNNADPTAGTDLYGKTCLLCHGADGNQLEPHLIDYFRSDGKYSEGFHKMIYGADERMTRAVAGNLTAQQAANILAWIQTQADDPNKTGFSR